MLRVSKLRSAQNDSLCKIQNACDDLQHNFGFGAFTKLYRAYSADLSAVDTMQKHLLLVPQSNNIIFNLDITMPQQLGLGIYMSSSEYI